MQSLLTKICLPFASAPLFFILYAVFLGPTYLLPYAGSNSSVVNALGAAAGIGLTPQFWAHAACLLVLISITWLRGCATSRQWIAVFPAIAALFDMAPGLSLIPLVPTVMHVVALVVGTRGSSDQANSVNVPAAGALLFAALGMAVIWGLVYSWTWQSRTRLGASSYVPSNHALPTNRAIQPTERPQGPVGGDARRQKPNSILGKWEDGGPVCASTKQAREPRNLELRVWYCEADEAAAKLIVVTHDQTINAFVDENSGLSIKLLPNGKIAIAADNDVRAKLGDGVFISEDLTLLSRK